MTPLDSISAGLQIISSWLMSVLALLGILVSVIVCLVFVELVIEHAAIAQAYTVKINSTGSDVSPMINKHTV
jgi:hypothetical protein